MELKLQQAIVATRAGRTDVAQSLLTQLIRENPDDANAWFLLGHIVDTPERQALYLQKTIELEPQHAIARERLIQLEDGPVPAPVIPDQLPMDENDQETEVDQSLGATAAVTATVAQLAESSQTLEDTQLESSNGDDAVWAQSAGRPLRESRETPAREAAATAAITQENPETKKEKASGEIWLVRVLVLMVIIAAIVLGILVLLILV